jgi:2-hydroxy-3-oxopropionate reductase
MLDAPVSGGEIGAVSGTLSIMVGGRRGCVRAGEANPRRDGESERVVRIGEAARGNSARCATRWS